MIGCVVMEISWQGNQSINQKNCILFEHRLRPKYTKTNTQKCTRNHCLSTNDMASFSWTIPTHVTASSDPSNLQAMPAEQNSIKRQGHSKGLIHLSPPPLVKIFSLKETPCFIVIFINFLEDRQLTEAKEDAPLVHLQMRFPHLGVAGKESGEGFARRLHPRRGCQGWGKQEKARILTLGQF